jgi:ABC-2 type transport system permease protein
VIWTLGLVIVIVATAAFYPSLAQATGDSLQNSSGAMSSLMGLSSSINPSTPLGYLWISLYANVLPWVLMALGIVLGTAAIAGDEDTGVLEYLLARPVNRTTVAVSRFAAAVTILFGASLISALSLIASIPFFQLGDPVTTTGIDGTTVTSPGASASDVLAGTFASFAVSMGVLGIAYLLGGITGRKGLTLGATSGFAIAGYVLYTLSQTTSSLEALTWVSPWRWYIADVMLIDGLTPNVLLPFGLAAVCFVVGWQRFLHRDLQSS